MHRNSTSKPSSIPLSVLKSSNRNATPHGSRNQLVKAKSKASTSTQKPKTQNVKSSSSKARVRSGSLTRVSLAFKGTPSKYITPKQNNHLVASSSKFSRLSTDTVRSSFGGKSVTGWPQNEPSFKTTCIDTVLEFLVTRKFPGNFKRDTLRNPSKNDFVDIFNFIYRHIDPHYELPARFDTEIPGLLKSLGYPVTLPKSVFTIVGSPHSWPSVLAMLAWLARVINSSAEFRAEDIAFNKDFEDDFDVLEKKFMSFINTYHDRSEETKQTELVEYRKALEKTYHLSEEEFYDMSCEKDKLASHLENMGSVEDEVRILQRTTEQLYEDERKLLKFNEDLKLHISAKDSERAKLDTQLEALHAQHLDLLAEIENLMTLKTSQNYHISQLKMLKNRPQEIEHQMEQLRAEKKLIDEQIWTTEVDISKLRKTLNESLLKYNALCTRLQLDGCEITQLEGAMERCKNEILPFIKSERKKAKDEELEAHNALLHCKREEGKMKEIIRAKEDECHKLECKVKRLEVEIDFEKEEMLKEENEQKRFYEKAEQKVLLARQELVNNNLYEQQKRLEEAKETLDAWTKRNTEVRQKGREIFLENVNKAKKAIEDRNKLIEEHRDRRYKFMAKALRESREIIESMKPILEKGEKMISKRGS